MKAAAVAAILIVLALTAGCHKTGGGRGGWEPTGCNGTSGGCSW